MHEKRRERGRTYRVGLILGFCLLIAVNGLFPVSCVYAEEEQTKIAYGENTPGQLYARSAVLMDADSGRILFAKNAETERPMASTTKIMTCILALERADPDQHGRSGFPDTGTVFPTHCTASVNNCAITVVEQVVCNNEIVCDHSQ